MDQVISPSPIWFVSLFVFSIVRSGAALTGRMSLEVPVVEFGFRKKKRPLNDFSYGHTQPLLPAGFELHDNLHSMSNWLLR